MRNRIAWNFIYQIPDAKDSRFKTLRNGWGIHGIVTVQSGQPFQFNCNFEDDFDGSGSYYGVPDIVGPVHYNQSNLNEYINLAAFAVPCTPLPSGFNGVHTGYSALRQSRAQFADWAALPAIRFRCSRTRN